MLQRRFNKSKLAQSRSSKSKSAGVKKNIPSKQIRYAVVGLGHIAQVAVLPAFRHARKNSVLKALISGDPVKLRKLSRKYKTKLNVAYDDYEEVLQSGEIDAVYIALPNDMHREYAERALRAGIHVLCEKPMAATVEDCESMIATAKESHKKLMIAYRLHFEEGNLKAIDLVKSGKIGEPRIFQGFLTYQIKDPDNIRLKEENAGGTLYDIGIYCINAARYIFQSEPEEVFAFSSNSNDERFNEIDEMTTGLMRFPNDRLAMFGSSFGAAAASEFKVIGTKGSLRVEHAFDYAEGTKHELQMGDKISKKAFGKKDQFSAELIYFSDCILKNKEPEPNGAEGLADVKIIEALYRAAKDKRAISIDSVEKDIRPDSSQEIDKPGISKPELIHVKSAS